MRYQYRPAAFLLFALLGLAGCTPAGFVVGTGATAGSIALEERGFQQSLQDKLHQAELLKALADRGFEPFQRIDILVFEGRVLMTGTVPSPRNRIDMAQLVWRHPKTLDVINALSITQESNLLDLSHDGLIENELKLELTLDNMVSAVNYHIDAHGGLLYLLGVAQNQAELDRVILHARKIEYVRKVISFVDLKDAPARQQRLAQLAKLAP